MKALNDMGNLDRGKLLADLFPEQLPNIILFIEQKAASFLQSDNEQTTFWGHPETDGFWSEVVTDIKQAIKKYAPRMAKNTRLFADQLFDGNNALFTIYCLNAYTRKPSCDPKLKQAITLLFGEWATKLEVSRIHQN